MDEITHEMLKDTKSIKNRDIISMKIEEAIKVIGEENPETFDVIEVISGTLSALGQFCYDTSCGLYGKEKTIENIKSQLKTIGPKMAVSFLENVRGEDISHLMVVWCAITAVDTISLIPAVNHDLKEAL